MKMHYKKGMPHPDSSGVRLHLTSREMTRKAGVMIMGHTGIVAPMATSKCREISTFFFIIKILDFRKIFHIFMTDMRVICGLNKVALNV